MAAPKAIKLLARMRQSKSGWTSSDLQKLFLGFGFEVMPGGSHDIVKHPDFPQFRYTLPRHAKELAKGYVDDAIKLIEKLEELKRQEEEDKDE